MSFYYFETTTEKFNQSYLECVGIVHWVSNGDNKEGLEKNLKDKLNKRLPPDKLIIFVALYEYKQAKKLFDIAFDAIDEHLQNTPVLFMPYNFDGEVSKPKSFKNYNETIKSFREKDVTELLQDGVKQAVLEAECILNAPSGFEFQKLTGKKSKHFYRAAEILNLDNIIAFLQHLLLASIPNQKSIIYVDSSTILTFALIIQQALNSFKQNVCSELIIPEIRNFHSYTGYKNYVFTNNCLVLISASSSGGLADKIKSRNSLGNDSFLHFLYAGENSNYPCIFKFKHNSTDKRKNIKSVININTETFTASNPNPNPVKITSKHLSSDEKKILGNMFISEAISVYQPNPQHEEFVSIQIDSTKIIDDKFKSWLTNKVLFTIPIGVDLIVYTDDNASNKMANVVLDLLKVRGIKNIEIKSETENISNQKEFNVIVILSVILLSSEKLLSISRSLREIKHKHRVYIIGYCFPIDYSTFNRDKNNLTYSGQGRKYMWSQYMLSPIGKPLAHQSFDIEKNNYNNLKQVPSTLKKRKSQLDNKLMKNELFLPKKNIEPLMLRPESILFNNNDKQNEICQISVYLSISIALQRARDSLYGNFQPILLENEMFSIDGFGASVLDPDMFCRFNDGVIQAALLRCTLPHELNYARSESLDEMMKNIIIGIINHNSSQQGEAVLEFLFALASKKITLSEKSENEIKEIIQSIKCSELKKVWNFYTKESAI